MASKLSVFLAELRRRKVYRVAAAYLAVGVAIAVAVPDPFAAFGFPAWAAPLVIVLIAIGFPIALVLAWAYEVRPEQKGDAASVPVVERAEQGKTSIVVLPFDNMSPDPGDAYFSDGLTEEIITNLSFLKALRVISRSSAMVLKATNKDVRTIAREMDVQYVLEGSVRKAGDELRITAQLIDATTDAHLWAEKYEGDLNDVFGIQASVSQSIVEALSLSLAAGEKERMLERDVQDPRAYECYLRARYDLHTGARESFEHALKTLEGGLRLYGESALLLATLGEAYWYPIDFGYERDDSYLDRAAELAKRALELEPGLPQGKNLLAHLERTRGDLATAARLMMEAHEGDPSDTGILLGAAAYSGWYIGNHSVSEALLDRLLTIDPLTPFNHFIHGLCHMVIGAYGSALDGLRRAEEMGLRMPWTRLWIGYVLAALGETERAVEELEGALEDGLPDPTAPMTRFFLAAIRGEQEPAIATLDKDTHDWAWRDPDFSMILPGMFTLMGEPGRAFDWLQHALDRGNLNYPFFASSDVFLTKLRSESRFHEMMAELKPRWEAFELLSSGSRWRGWS